MFSVYILYSKSYDKTYVGFTSDLAARLLSHNKLATKGYTVKYRPWVVMHSEEFSTKKEAMAREKFFKTGVGRESIKEIKLAFLQ